MLYRVIVSGEIAKIALRENDLREKLTRKLSRNNRTITINNQFISHFKIECNSFQLGNQLGDQRPQ